MATLRASLRIAAAPAFAAVCAAAASRTAAAEPAPAVAQALPKQVEWPTADIVTSSAGTDRREGQVELKCSSMNPDCSRVRAFFGLKRVPVSVVHTSPLEGNVIDGAAVSDVVALVGKMQEAAASPLARAEDAQWCAWAEKVLPYFAALPADANQRDLLRHVNLNVFRSPHDAKATMSVAADKSEVGFAQRLLLRHVFSGSKYVENKWAKGQSKYVENKWAKWRMGVTEERVVLNSLLDEWMKAVGNRAFMGG
ncbi:hypothetical protein T484DRAFT_1806896 [Baffinella frigidus]|nr:hypothetical protein T484DRAFT_1806896 [Cryptophyta sp. CCMP2293]